MYKEDRLVTLRSKVVKFLLHLLLLPALIPWQKMLVLKKITSKETFYIEYIFQYRGVFRIFFIRGRFYF